MGEARDAPCTPWTTEDRVLDQPAACAIDPPPPAAAVTEAIDVAGWILYRLTDRQWPGICADTIELSGACACGHWPGHWSAPHACRAGLYWPGIHPVSGGGPRLDRVPNVDPGPHLPWPAIRLGYSPIIEVTEVTIDGTVLDPAAYRIVDYVWLARTDTGGTWGGDVIVTFTHGKRPPTALERAAATLAAEVLASRVGAPCRLPDRTQSVVRQGITVAWTDKQEFLASGLTGITEVDLAIMAARRSRRRSRVYSAQQRVRAHRAT
jgi:hypothetical protein